MRNYYLRFLVFITLLALPLQGFADDLDGGGDSVSPPSLEGSYSGNTIADLLCSVVNWFTGDGSVGQGIATLAVIVLGIGASLGKVSYGMALTTMVGIATIFGASDIVYELTGQMACYGDILGGLGGVLDGI